MPKRRLRLLRFERNTTIPHIFLKMKSVKVHNGKKFRRIKLNKFMVGNRLGYYLITQSLTKLKKKKKKKR